MEEDEIDDGGPAFPRPYSTDGGSQWAQVGMSLRDYFAGQAMAACIGAPRDSRNYHDATAVVAEWAYQYADAMLAEGKKKRT